MENNTCEGSVADQSIQRSSVFDSSLYFGNTWMFLPHESFNSAPGVSHFVWDQKHAVDLLLDSSTTTNLIHNSRSGKK